MRRGIRSGELDTLLTFQRATTSNHPVTNERVRSWELLKTVRGKELRTKSDDTFEADQQVTKNEKSFFIRWGAAHSVVTADSSVITADSATITADNYYGIVKVIDERMRMIVEGQVLYINSIESRGKREGWAIIKAEVRSGQS